MSKEKVHVEIDIHEPGELTALMDEHEEVEEWTLDSLPAGDIAIGPVGFERKTMSDYTSTLLEGRLDEQTAKMKQRYEHPYILLEGDLTQTDNPLDAVTSNISPKALRGSMASLTARHGVPVILCSNLSLLADMAVRLARKHIEEGDGLDVPRGAVTGRDEPTAKKIYGCLDGVGADTAETLYEQFPSIQNFMANATTEDLRELDGIGKKRAEQIMNGFR